MTRPAGTVGAPMAKRAVLSLPLKSTGPAMSLAPACSTVDKASPSRTWPGWNPPPATAVTTYVAPVFLTRSITRGDVTAFACSKAVGDPFVDVTDAAAELSEVARPEKIWDA